jgi:hypothetical protein
MAPVSSARFIISRRRAPRASTTQDSSRNWVQADHFAATTGALPLWRASTSAAATASDDQEHQNLPPLDVGELGDEINPLRLREPRDGGAPGVNPQARLTPLARAGPVVCVTGSDMFGVPWRSVDDYTSV